MTLAQLKISCNRTQLTIHSRISLKSIAIFGSIEAISAESDYQHQIPFRD